MPRLKMVDAGLPYKKIMQGSKWVGRVYKNAQGTYTGQIGKAPNRIEVTAATEREAFSEVAARHFGMANAAALAQHNAEVRAHNRAVRPPRRRGRSAFDQMLDMLGSMPRSAPLSAEEETQREIMERGEDEFVYRTTTTRRRN
jgi:hypothetical protein